RKASSMGPESACRFGSPPSRVIRQGFKNDTHFRAPSTTPSSTRFFSFGPPERRGTKLPISTRSEERRVGKERRHRGWTEHCEGEEGIRVWSVTGVQTCALPI